MASPYSGPLEDPLYMLSPVERYRERWRCSVCGSRESKLPGAVPRMDGTPGPRSSYQKACSTECRRKRSTEVLNPRYERKPTPRIARRAVRAERVAAQCVEWLGEDFSRAFGGRDEAVSKLGLALERYLEGNPRGLRREKRHG